MATLEKARIYDPDAAQAYSFYVQFNPSSIDISERFGKQADKGVRAKKKDGGAEEIQTQGDPVTALPGAQMSVKLFYNTYRSASDFDDVRSRIKQFYYFQGPPGVDTDLVNKRIAFSWGSLTMIGTMTALRVSYQMFAPSGVPVRAEVTLEIVGDDPDRTAAAIDQSEDTTIKDPADWRTGSAVPDNVKALFQGA